MQPPPNDTSTAKQGKLLPFPAPPDNRAGAISRLRALIENIEKGHTRAVLVVDWSEDDQSNGWWMSGNVTHDTAVINLERIKRELLD